MKKRPCKCGCKFEDHKPILIKNQPSLNIQCRKCPEWIDEWCYNYRPIGNLEYLEDLYDSSR